MADKRTGRRPKFERKADKSPKTLEELFQVFYDAKVSEGVSKRTLETYRENFRFLCEYLDRLQLSHDVANVDTELLRSYQSWMYNAKLRFDGHEHKSEKEKTVGLSPVTVNTRTKNLRTMFRFHRTEGLIEVDPRSRYCRRSWRRHVNAKNRRKMCLVDSSYTNKERSFSQDALIEWGNLEGCSFVVVCNFDVKVTQCPQLDHVLVVQRGHDHLAAGGDFVGSVWVREEETRARYERGKLTLHDNEHGEMRIMNSLSR